MTPQKPQNKRNWTHVNGVRKHLTWRNIIMAKLFIIGGFLSHLGLLWLIKWWLAGVGILSLSMLKQPDAGNMNEIAFCGDNNAVGIELCDGTSFNKNLKITDTSIWACSNTCQLVLREWNGNKEEPKHLIWTWWTSFQKEVIKTKPSYNTQQKKITTVAPVQQKVEIIQSAKTAVDDETIEDFVWSLVRNSNATVKTTTRASTPVDDDEWMEALVKALMAN